MCSRSRLICKNRYITETKSVNILRIVQARHSVNLIFLFYRCMMVRSGCVVSLRGSCSCFDIYMYVDNRSHSDGYCGVVLCYLD